MSDADEYLERLFAAGLKREIDSDESVWGTLPFFATAIGIIGAVLGYDAAQLPQFAWRLFPLAAHVLLAAAFLCLCASFSWLFAAVRQREYRYPPSETDIQTLAAEYRTYHRDLGLADDALESAIVRSVRTIMVDEYALSATQNRNHNRRKLFARSQAIFFLMIGLAISFTYGAFAFVEHRLLDARSDVKGALNGGAGQARGPAASATLDPCAAAPATSTADPRRRATLCNHPTPAEQVMTKPNQPVPPAPEPKPDSSVQPQRAEPRRPDPVLMRKSDDGNGPLQKK